ncbi:uncharacterized protein AB675_7182 [Cyphellophora attinorum]|uniref:Uncharacterized protein n=1 Tax=Cyphellophora attinorum TaxID=1664694 RepID=A0A0N1H8S7_9EURO|nr:uncharacterized protein AB675_7182 [Phialophora attinorum]KPI43513.1 hypothetical protein AB675_7182 [Phialophora attinorum]
MGRLGVSAYSKSASSSRNNLDAPLTSVPFDDFNGRFANTLTVSEPISRTQTPEPSPDITYSDRHGILRHALSKSGSASSKSRTPAWKLLRSWITEVIALFLAICALLSIVSVLRVYQGKPIDDLDLPSALTLNGLLALLGTILRAVLAVPLGSVLAQEAWLWLASNNKRQIPRSRLRDLVASDSASRGEWGSFLLLFRSWRRAVAFLGALVMVLCLAIDTFTQQLVASASTLVTNSASDWNPGNVPWNQHYASFQGNPAEAAFGPTLNIKAAAYAGFLADSVEDYQVACQTGNCTFPATPSVAVCGSCVPTTNSMGACNETSCSYKTSTGTVFEMGHFNSSGPGIGFSSQSIFNSSLGSAQNLTVADFETIGVPYQSLSSGLYGSNPTFSSQRCQIWMCVNVYETVVENGLQTQNTTATFSDVPNTVNRGFSGADNWTFVLPDQWSHEKYNVSALGWAALSEQLGTMFTGTVLLNLEGYSISSDAVEAIWNGTTDMQPWMDKVTRSLSNAMRLDSTADDPAFNGSAYQLSVVVRWGWLALPASLVLLSILLIVIIMTKTARSDIGSWKGSPLAMLLVEVDDDIRLQSMKIADEEGWESVGTGVESRLAEQRVALQRAGDGRYRLGSLRRS